MGGIPLGAAKREIILEEATPTLPPTLTLIREATDIETMRKKKALIPP